MKILTNSEALLMENIVSVSQESLQNVLYKFLKDNYKRVIYDEDFLVAEGDIPIALVAHMDTVFKMPPTEVFYDRKKNVMWSPTGLGADDRAGVYAIVQIIKSGFRPHIIFTTDEEIGCVGAQSLAEIPCPFKELKYIIQLDRRNSNDCVFYDCDNEDFKKYVESFGFVTAWGSFTDICEICSAWWVAGVNLSIGYRDEHTTSEVLFVGQMLSTIDKVKKMLSEKDIPSFTYIPAKGSYYHWGHHSYYYPGYGYEDYLDYYYDDEVAPVANNYAEYKNFDEYYADKKDYLYPKGSVLYRCAKCKKSFKDDEVLDVKLIKGGKGFMCIDCIGSNIDWCRDCGDAFEVNPKNPQELCPDCRKKKK